MQGEKEAGAGGRPLKGLGAAAIYRLGQKHVHSFITRMAFTESWQRSAHEAGKWPGARPADLAPAADFQ